MGKLKPWFAVRHDEYGMSKIVIPPNVSDVPFGQDIHYVCPDGDCMLIWATSRKEAEQRMAEAFQSLVN